MLESLEVRRLGLLEPVFVEGAGSPGRSFDGDPIVDLPEQDTEGSSDTRESGAGSRLSGPRGKPRLLLRHLAREAARSVRVARVGIWKFDAPDDGIRLVARYDRGEDALLENQAYSNDLGRAFRKVVTTVSALVVEDTHRHGVASAPIRGWIDDESVRAVLAFPVRDYGLLVGLVTFEERRNPRKWTAQDRALAASLAFQATEPLLQLIDHRPPVGSHLGAALPIEAPPTEAASGPNVSSEEKVLQSLDMPTAASSDASQDRLFERAPRWSSVPRRDRLQGAAVLGTAEVVDALGSIDVMGGYLGLLAEAVCERPDDLSLVSEAKEASEAVREGLLRFLGCVNSGIPDRREWDLNALISESIPALARETGDLRRLRVAPTASVLRLRANSALLERALVHLVRNSCDASVPGHDVRLSWGPYLRETKDEGVTEWALVQISDAGEGIASEHFPWLFEPFFSTRKDGNPLRGLGLPLVQNVVEGHGGWIEVHSTPDEGTEVDVFLPLVETRRFGRSVRDAEGSPSANEGQRGRPERVIVLEDEPLLGRLLHRVLSRHGYDVEVVPTADEAERLRKLGGAADLLIAERALAGARSGVEIAESWRSESPTTAAIILDRNAAIERDSDSPERVAGLPLLRRPFEPGDVLSLVRDALAKISRQSDDSDRQASNPPSGPDAPEPRSDHRAH